VDDVARTMMCEDNVAVVGMMYRYDVVAIIWMMYHYDVSVMVYVRQCLLVSSYGT
jgi:hypothetical protein